MATQESLAYFVTFFLMLKTKVTDVYPAMTTNRGLGRYGLLTSVPYVDRLLDRES